MEFLCPYPSAVTADDWAFLLLCLLLVGEDASQRRFCPARNQFLFVLR